MGITTRVLAALQSDPTHAFVLLDESGVPVWATPSIFSLVDLDLASPNPLANAIHPDDAALCDEVFAVEHDGRGDERFTMECRYELVLRARSPKGEWRRVAFRLLNLVDDPEVNGHLLQLTLANQELNAVAAFDSTATGAPVTVVLSDLLAALETGGTSQGFAAVFDASGSCIAASPAAPIGPGDSRSADAWRRCMNRGASLSVPVVCPAGVAIGVLELNSHFADVRPFTRYLAQQVSQRVGVVLDHDRNRKELVRTAAIDSLTGLLNRWSFHAAYEALPDSLAVWVFFVDLDRFKVVNDTYGHEAGDAVLVDVARRLRSISIDGDLIARLGGDEFIMVRPRPAGIHGGVDDPDRCVARLESLLDGPVLFDGHLIHTRSSVGFAEGSVGDRRDLIARADADMYAAKRLRKLGSSLLDSR